MRRGGKPLVRRWPGSWRPGLLLVFHPEWLANPVLVLKKNGTWRMCVDYTDLNKACPADPFTLPRIDQIIDATAGCERLSFGYLLWLSSYQDGSEGPEEDNFYNSLWIVLLCVYAFWAQECPGDLPAVCVQNCLHNQIGSNVHAYVDTLW